MKPLPLPVQTLIADLAQRLDERVVAASVHVKTVAGRRYLYAREKTISGFRDRSLGAAADPRVQAEAENVLHASARARARRKLVTLIKRAGVWAPNGMPARVIDALDEAKLFSSGLILIGTGAYQLFPCVVGAALSASGLQTQDLDLAVADTSMSSDSPLLDILRTADATFVGAPGLDPRDPPKRFLNAEGFCVDVLTPVRSRHDRDPMTVAGLAAGATPQQFLPFLLTDAIRAPALIGSGIAVTVPQPARYAVHKLIVAQRRNPGNLKRAKDLLQARELMAALALAEPMAVDDALDEARAKGREWRRLIDLSLRELGRLPDEAHPT